jgi:hypothetical protein
MRPSPDRNRNGGDAEERLRAKHESRIKLQNTSFYPWFCRYRGGYGRLGYADRATHERSLFHVSVLRMSVAAAIAPCDIADLRRAFVRSLKRY